MGTRLTRRTGKRYIKFSSCLHEYTVVLILNLLHGLGTLWYKIEEKLCVGKGNLDKDLVKPMIVMLAAFSISLLTVLCYLWSGCRYLLLSVGFGVIFVKPFLAAWIQGISVDSGNLCGFQLPSLPTLSLEGIGKESVGRFVKIFRYYCIWMLLPFYLVPVLLLSTLMHSLRNISNKN